MPSIVSDGRHHVYGRNAMMMDENGRKHGPAARTENAGEQFGTKKSIAIRLFGSFSGEVHGVPFKIDSSRSADGALRSETVLCLLVWLILEPEWGVSTDRLKALWRSNNDYNLSRAKSDLRRALGSESWRVPRASSARDRLRMDLEGADTDVRAFGEALLRGTIKDLLIAAKHYQGPLLEDRLEIHADRIQPPWEWIADYRAQYHEQFRSAIEAIVREAITLYDAPESAREAIARCLKQTALHFPNDLALLYQCALGLHHLKRFPAVREIYDSIALTLPNNLNEQFRKLLDQRPPIAQQQMTDIVQTLPRAVNLIGRDKEIRGLLDWLRSPMARLDMVNGLSVPSDGRSPRMITVTGEPGIGKTELAIAVANRYLVETGTPVIFIELATEKRLYRTIAETLKLTLDPESRLEPVVMEYLNRIAMLLVLDNCESIVGVSYHCSQLLERCPLLRILATSHSPLQVDGEKEFSARPLSLPARYCTLNALMMSEAAQLFLARSDQRLDMGPDDVSALADVCRRTGGIPLMIHLAAARVQYFPNLQSLSYSMGTMLPLRWRGASRTRPESSLYALLDWSVGNLDFPEQARELLPRLAVFRRSWSIEAAEIICSGNGIDREEIAAVLSDLCRGSLVRHHGNRYFMLEPVRMYASEELTSRSANELWNRYVRYFLHNVPEMLDRTDTVQLAVLREEADNIVSALQKAHEYSEGNQALICLLKTARLLALWIPGSVRLDLLRTALVTAKAGNDLSSVGRILNEIGVTLREMGSYREAEERFMDACAVFHELGDLPRATLVRYNLAAVYRRQARFAEARKCYEEDLACCRDRQDHVGEATTLCSLGILYWKQRYAVDAVRSFRDALAVLNVHCAVLTEFDACNGLASLLIDEELWPNQELKQCRLDEAKGLLDRAMIIAKELRVANPKPESERKEQCNEAILFNQLGKYYAAIAEWDLAERYHQDALAIKRQLDDRSGVGITYNNLGDLYRRQKRWDKAIAHYLLDLSICREVGDVEGVCEVLQSMARVEACQNHWSHAVDLTREALCELQGSGFTALIREIELDLAQYGAQAILESLQFVVDGSKGELSPESSRSLDRTYFSR